MNLFETLYNDPNPDSESPINQNSMVEIHNPAFEKSLVDADVGTRFQFERNGYFILNTVEDERLSFNRIVTLKDTWAKIQKKKG